MLDWGVEILGGLLGLFGELVLFSALLGDASSRGFALALLLAAWVAGAVLAVRARLTRRRVPGAVNVPSVLSFGLGLMALALTTLLGVGLNLGLQAWPDTDDQQGAQLSAVLQAGLPPGLVLRVLPAALLLLTGRRRPDTQTAFDSN